MSQRRCCVPGCLVTVKDGVPLHKFPNPNFNMAKFNSWISNIGGELAAMDTATIYHNRRVCHNHFKDVYKYPKNRLSKLAIPDLHVPELSLAATISQEPAMSFTSSVENVLTGLPSTAALTKEQAIPSTSGVENILKSGHPNVFESIATKRQECITKHKNVEKKPNKTRSACVSIQQHKKYKSILKRLRKCEKDKLRLKRKYLVARKLMKTTAFKIVSKHMSATAKIFCQMQATQSGKKKLGRRFTMDEKILALSLYKPSPKAYRLLGKLCVLPSRRTLQNLLHKVNLKAGINELIFENLKNRVATMPDKFKYCTLVFDEMAIGPGISYDKQNDKIIGFVQDGEKNKKEYCDHVLVFMVRGIVKKYKQPLAYYFCNGSTKAIELKAHLKNIIGKIQDTGLKVIATVCDQGASNMAAINCLLKETKENYLRRNRFYDDGFFEVNSMKIFPIFDPPHLLKGVRNNLITKNLHFTMKGKTYVAKWSHLIELYNKGFNFDGVKLVPKLTAHHVMPELIPKMRVKHCSQVFSNSVGVALGFMAEMGGIDKEAMETAKLLMFFDKLFDSVNGSYSHPVGGKLYRAAVTPTSAHHNLWNESIPVLKSMRFSYGINNGVVPSLASWVKTIENFRRLCKYMYEKGVNSLLLRNINQDALENFFGAVRAHGYSNVMPTASAFESAFKTLLINNLTSPHSVGSNCEKDDSICLQSLKNFLTKPENIKPTECGEEIEYTDLNLNLPNTDEMITSSSPTNVEKSAAIGYCSGWMAQQAKRNIYKSCATCKKDLESETIESFHNYIKKKEFENKKWLCYPTRALFDFFAQIEYICIEILKNNCTKENLINYIKLILNVHLDFSFFNCAAHKKTLIEYIIHKSVLFFVQNWCKKINKILCGKDTCNAQGDAMIEKALRHYSKNKGRKRKRQNDVINV